MLYYDVLNDYSLGLIGETPPIFLDQMHTSKRGNVTLYYNEHDEMVYASSPDELDEYYLY